MNNFSIGIELVNADDGKDPYTAPQMQALHNVIAYLKHRFPLEVGIVSHEFIALPHGRKVDPKGYPWVTLADLGLTICR